MAHSLCLFCRIAAHDLPAEIVYEDAHVIAFLDREPCVVGHTLIIPKRHAETLSDLREEDVGPLFQAVRTTGDLLLKNLGAEGLTIGINQGSVSGQAIPHIHVHIFPRSKNDGGSSVHSVVRVPVTESLNRTGRRVRGEEI